MALSFHTRQCQPNTACARAVAWPVSMNFPSATVLACVLLGAMSWQLSATGRMQTEATRTFGSLLVLDSGPCQSVPWGLIVFLLLLLLKLWKFVCLSSLFLSLAMVPRSCGIGLGPEDGIIGRKMQSETWKDWEVSRVRDLKVLREGKLKLVPQKCRQALTFHPLLRPLW